MKSNHLFVEWSSFLCGKRWIVRCIVVIASRWLTLGNILGAFTQLSLAVCFGFCSGCPWFCHTRKQRYRFCCRKWIPAVLRCILFRPFLSLSFFFLFESFLECFSMLLELFFFIRVIDSLFQSDLKCEHRHYYGAMNKFRSSLRRNFF